jgi:hypothetical protein
MLTMKWTLRDVSERQRVLLLERDDISLTRGDSLWGDFLIQALCWDWRPAQDGKAFIDGFA